MNWRAHYAGALYATGVPTKLIALALGNFQHPVSRTMVHELLKQSGAIPSEPRTPRRTYTRVAMADTVDRTKFSDHITLRLAHAIEMWLDNPGMTIEEVCRRNKVSQTAFKRRLLELRSSI